jgi:thioredoxin reductase (NADPH)
MYDIIIIGSGPAGLSAAIYTCRAKLSGVVVEKDYMGSGQIAASEQVDNYPGLPGIGGYELGDKFREHAEKFGTEFYEGEVSEILADESNSENKSFTVKFKDGNSVCGRSVIYAAGTSYRHLDIEGGGLLGVSYCATCDGAFYNNKVTAVIGGGDTALGDALYLSNICDKVYLIHRRDEFRANKTLQEKVKNTPNIEILYNSVPSKVNGEKRVESLEIIQSGERIKLDVSGVFVAIGSIPNTQLLRESNLSALLDESGYVIAGEDGKTCVQGFFAAGDVRTKKLRQVVTAVSDGANAVESAVGFLNGTD